MRPDRDGPDNRAAMNGPDRTGDSIKARPAVRRHAKRHAGRIDERGGGDCEKQISHVESFRLPGLVALWAIVRRNG